MHRRFLIPPSALLLLAMLVACGNKPTETSDTGSDPSAAPKPGLLGFAKKPIVLPEGTVVTVRLNESISTKRNHAGDGFTSTVAAPIEEGGKVVIPKDATATGTVTEAIPLGRFKGGARLRLSLDSVTFNGNTYNVHTSSVSKSAKGKGKRTAAMIGGGAGGGALIGALAGGGKGAAIGALVGAGAGTAGSAFTGNKDIVIPAESALSFKLLQPLEVKM